MISKASENGQISAPLGQGPPPSVVPVQLAVLVCWLGPWPRYFDLYLHSCRYNPQVDFLLFSDQAAPPDLPANVKVIPFSMADFNALASKTMGFPVAINYAFKLCDFKAAYGHIFQNFLKKYTHWVLGDLDVVYGQIDQFWNHDLLAGRDIVSSREEFLTGHGTVFRNVDAVNHFYQESPDSERVFRSEEFFSFSECNKMWQHFNRGGTAFDAKPEVWSMTHLAHASKLDVLFTHLVREEGDLRGRWRLIWDAGNLYDAKTRNDVLYFHFHNYKYRWYYRIPKWTTMPGKFKMTSWGFFAKPERENSLRGKMGGMIQW